MHLLLLNDMVELRYTIGNFHFEASYLIGFENL